MFNFARNHPQWIWVQSFPELFDERPSLMPYELNIPENHSIYGYCHLDTTDIVIIVAEVNLHQSTKAYLETWIIQLKKIKR